MDGQEDLTDKVSEKGDKFRRIANFEEPLFPRIEETPYATLMEKDPNYKKLKESLEKVAKIRWT